MCAGKLLSLIKKCLHREKGGQRATTCDCGNSNNNSKTGQARSTGPATNAAAAAAASSAVTATSAGAASAVNVTARKMSPGQAAGCTTCAETRPGYTRMCLGPAPGHDADHPTHAHPTHAHPTHAHGHSGAHCCHGQPCNPVVYVPSSTPLDRVEREVALQIERQRRLAAIQTDTELNLPPAISISEDGEEGYATSQRLLQLSCQQSRRSESIRPPPNKTVPPGCGESPPPYRSHSVSDGSRAPRGWGGPPQSYPPAARHNSPHIARCHSISAGERRPASQRGGEPHVCAAMYYHSPAAAAAASGCSHHGATAHHQGAMVPTNAV